jgi:hypothetical protein
MQLLDEVRDAARRPIAIVLVHHENKGGDISGAFEAEFDTVIHVKPDGRFRTQLYFRKSRWSSRIHRSRATLAWVTERDTFDVVETDIDVDQTAAAQDVRHKVKAEIRAWILEYVDENPGLARGTVETACAESHGRGGRTLAREVIGEELVHGGGLEPGPGKSPTGIYLYRAGTAQAPLDGLSPEDELERPPSARGLPDAESIVALQDDRQ